MADATSGTDPALEVRALHYSYKRTQALRGVSFSVAERSIHGFVGPNGAGKTTALKVLATLLKPQGGQATVFGHDIVRDYKLVRRSIGFMPDEFNLYRRMTVFECLDFFGAAYKIPLRKRRGIVDDVLALTDLTSKADEFVSAFSRGMKQRCCLAKTLLHDPKVLILDEPASGLDPRARIEIRELLKTLRDMGKTILISSHILSELGDMCNKIGIIERGVLLSAGDYREILKQIRREAELRLEVLDGADTAAAVLAEMSGISNIDRSGNEFQLASTLSLEELAGLHARLVNAGVKVLFLEQDKGTLEDVFLHVTKGGL